MKAFLSASRFYAYMYYFISMQNILFPRVPIIILSLNIAGEPSILPPPVFNVYRVSPVRASINKTCPTELQKIKYVYIL